MCPQSTNKGYEVQTTASNTGTWGAVLNDQVIEYIDQNMGGLTSKTLSNVNVTLSASESRSAILRLTGVLTGNVVITTSCIGFFFVENACTGAFAVTVRNTSVATAATVSPGVRATVISDTTNGCRAISSGFETGVKAAFYMATAPIGWTRDTTATFNNALPRLVTTGGAATGGTNNFTDINTNLILTRANLPNVSITSGLSGEHDHFLVADATNTANEANPVTASTFIARRGTTSTSAIGYELGSSAITPTLALTTTEPNHTHTVSLNGGTTQTAVNINIKYADFLVATRN